MAAVRDVRPVYYERYMIDYKNKSPQVQQGARDRIHWYFSMDYPGRRAYSEKIATNIYYEQMAFAWPNWAKLFFNNKGVAARATDVWPRIAPHLGSGRWFRQPGKLHPGPDTEPAEDVAEVVVDCARADEQRRAGLGIGQALGDQVQHFDLARR